MASLASQLQRLYLLPPGDTLMDPAGCTRTLVLELLAPVDAAQVAALWRGLQDGPGWPAPAIAVSGDGLALWCACEAPLTAAAAEALARQQLEALLPGLPEGRARVWPQAGQHAELPGRALADGERWTAFIASDLAPLFTETPWLDIAPGEDGQATLLAGLACVPAARLAAAPPAPARRPTVAAADAPAVLDPRAFLQQVMADPAVPLALRIEAAKALLANGQRQDGAAGRSIQP